LEFNKKQWEATSAICVVPGFINRESNIPIFFSDGSEKLNISIQHDKKQITDWGTNAQEATANIAMKYWTKAEFVFVIDNFEHGFQILPSTSFLMATVLFTPSQDLLDELGTNLVINLGNVVHSFNVSI
jgi:hypothetical protein